MDTTRLTNFFEQTNKFKQFELYNVPNNAVVNAEILMNQPVSKTFQTSPGNLRVILFERLRHT